MTTVAILNIIVVLFAYLARYRQMKFGLEVSYQNINSRPSNAALFNHSCIWLSLIKLRPSRAWPRFYQLDAFYHFKD